MQQLVDHGADPNLPEEQYAPKGKALYSAVCHGHYEIAKLLLERGAFPNPPGESRARRCGFRGNGGPDKRMEQLLVSYGARPTQERREEDWPTRAHNWLRISPLHEAPRKADVREAKKLLGHTQALQRTQLGPERVSTRGGAAARQPRSRSSSRCARIAGAG